MTAKQRKARALKAARDISSVCVGAPVRTLSRSISRVYDDRLRPLGIRFSQMNILTMVTLAGPITAAEVGRRLDIEKSTLSRNLAIMKANGWLAVEPQGRTKLLTVTAAGQRLLVDARVQWQSAQDDVVAMLGNEAATVIRQAFTRLGVNETAD